MSSFSTQLIKRKKLLAGLGLLSLYILMVNINMAQRARLLEEQRYLSKDLGGGECTIEPIAEITTVPVNVTKTLLASYPGSGKRFAWNVISAISNHEVADDWNFSGALDENTLAIKTSWPHKEGVWSWGEMMDQVILLIRNPRWALPSYHTMRFELDYSDTWAESYMRIPNTYTERPAVHIWENWRDNYFDIEMERWASYIDFWMSGGGQIVNGTETTHARCLNSGMECDPVGVLDFDIFYVEHPTSEFFKLGQIFDSVQNIEMIAMAARFCLLDKVYEDKTLHNSNRDGNGPIAAAFKFTVPQLKTMLDVTTALRDKYLIPPSSLKPKAGDLVFILNNYINQINAEYWVEHYTEMYNIESPE